MCNASMPTADALRCVARDIELFYKKNAKDKDWCIKTCHNAANQFENAFAELYKLRARADAAPVVRGEWEVAIGYDPNKKVQCQNCYKMAYEPTPYCPNCGCKMEDKPCG